MGRPPVGIARMLRMYFLQQCYTLADEVLEDALYPSSTKNERGERQPQMHQAKQGNQWQFGMKVHTGLDKRPEVISAQERGRLRADIEWRLALKRGQVQQMPKSPAKALTQWCVRRRVQVPAIVEHRYHIIKNLFGYRKVSYRGLVKNQAPALALAA